MPNKSAALEKEMKVRSAKPNKWLRFYRCIPLYLMFLAGDNGKQHGFLRGFKSEIV